jgi:hypothetical protein
LTIVATIQNRFSGDSFALTSQTAIANIGRKHPELSIGDGNTDLLWQDNLGKTAIWTV